MIIMIIFSEIDNLTTFLTKLVIKHNNSKRDFLTVKHFKKLVICHGAMIYIKKTVSSKKRLKF